MIHHEGIASMNLIERKCLCMEGYASTSGFQRSVGHGCCIRAFDHGRRHTGMVDESKEDLMAAYKLDPDNKAVRKELQLLKASLFPPNLTQTKNSLIRRRP